MALERLPEGEKLTILINSGGGSVFAGQEIYSMLYGRNDIEIKIQSIAGSAASVIAMSNYTEISPVAMIMIHNVAAGNISGDYHEMEKYAEILKEMNSALAAAYVQKTGKSEEEILKAMDCETWLPAQKALELGFVDAIISDRPLLTNSIIGMRLTEDVRNEILAKKAIQTDAEQEKQQLLNDLYLYGA